MLTVYTGPMFSGKSQALLHSLSRYADIAKDIPGHTSPLLINHSLDATRDRPDGEKISSHSSQYKGVSPLIKTVYASTLNDIDVSTYTCIGVDEIQWFKDTYETIQKWLFAGKSVYVAGLNSDAFLKPFGEVHLLLSIATTFQHLSAICPFCVKEAHVKGLEITPALIDNYKAAFTLKHSGEHVLIDAGGDDKYMPSCFKHHIEHGMKF